MVSVDFARPQSSTTGRWCGGIEDFAATEVLSRARGAAADPKPTYSRADQQMAFKGEPTLGRATSIHGELLKLGFEVLSIRRR